MLDKEKLKKTSKEVLESIDPLIAMLPNTHNDEDYKEGSEFYIENYLKNNLGNKNKNYSKLGHVRKNGLVVDRFTEYSTNNFSYRGNDWTEVASILSAGCSMTYGLGVPFNGTWPKILEDITGKTVHNLSRPGMSIQELVFQIFAYFKTFGNPDTLLCLFPDPFRMQVPVKKNLITSGNGHIDGALGDVYLYNIRTKKISDREKYIKIPYNYEDILPMEFPLFISMKLIHLLEQYCNSNNINFVWSSWDENFRDVVSQIDNVFSNFNNSEDFDSEYPINKDCHQEYKDIFLNYFDSGQDIEDGLHHSHPGVHWHKHVADVFYKRLNK